MSTSLEESGGYPEHSLKRRNEFNRMSMPASKQKRKNAPSTGGNRRADDEEVCLSLSLCVIVCMCVCVCVHE